MPVTLENLFESDSLDAKSLDFLLNAIKANAQQGFDYLKFKQSIVALQGMNMPEETAIKSAFSTITTLGITKENLLNSINHYHQIIQKEKSEFDTAHAKQTNIRVHQKLNETNFLQEKIKAHKIQIAELEKQISEFQYKIDHADKEIEEAKHKIQETKERFEETYVHLEKVFKTDIDTFNKYL